MIHSRSRQRRRTIGGGHLPGPVEGPVGDVSAFVPPGDIHRVRNSGSGVAVSIHVYGTDVTRIGSSVRRFYD
jgi:3-mercaptopropionate dioxygenase